MNTLDMIAAGGIDGIDTEDLDPEELAALERAGLIEQIGCSGARLSHREFAQRIVDGPPGIDSILVILKGSK